MISFQQYCPGDANVAIADAETAGFCNQIQTGTGGTGGSSNSSGLPPLPTRASSTSQPTQAQPTPAISADMGSFFIQDVLAVLAVLLFQI